MYNVYVPYEDLSSFSNYYFNDDFTLIYATNDNINYDIIDLKNHYSIVNSNVDLSTNLMIPIDNSFLTNNWTYRNDLTDIFINLFFFCSFFLGIPLLILSKLFKKKL